MLLIRRALAIIGGFPSNPSAPYPMEATTPMAAKKKSSTPLDAAGQAEAYAKAVESFGAALQIMRTGDHAKAREALLQLDNSLDAEPELAERTRSYIRICERRLTPEPPSPQSVVDCFERAVFELNNGEWDIAIRLLDQALQQEPNSVNCLYARAAAWALQGKADRAVNDLRQAISMEPSIRFQAVNDTDFERIREEPAFIDIIEPTPAGT